MQKSFSFLTGLAVVSTLLLPAYAVAQNNQVPMNMGYPVPPAMVSPQGGHYPAPQMSQQMMQQMMARQKQKMLDMQEQQKAQQQAMAAEANQNRSSVKGESCKHHGKKAVMHERMAQRDAHMERMEKSLANIEKLMQEMISLMKSKY